MARRLLSILLLAMAAGQLSDIPGFVDVVATYQVGGTTLAWALAVGLVVGEVASGVGLLAAGHARRRRPAALAVVVAGVWSLLAAQAFARGLVLDNCGCFGVHLGQPLRWWVLLEDVELVALALWVHRQATRRSPTATRPSSSRATTTLRPTPPGRPLR